MRKVVVYMYMHVSGKSFFQKIFSKLISIGSHNFQGTHLSFIKYYMKYNLLMLEISYIEKTKGIANIVLVYILLSFKNLFLIQQFISKPEFLNFNRITNSLNFIPRRKITYL